jgi:hypothetical protein
MSDYISTELYVSSGSRRESVPSINLTQYYGERYTSTASLDTDYRDDQYDDSFVWRGVDNARKFIEFHNLGRIPGLSDQVISGANVNLADCNLTGSTRTTWPSTVTPLLLSVAMMVVSLDARIGSMNAFV